MSGLEIERKFRVVSDDYKTMAFAQSRIKQGYISSRQGVTVRVRQRGDCGFLTHSPSNSRFTFFYSYWIIISYTQSKVQKNF